MVSNYMYIYIVHIAHFLYGATSYGSTKTLYSTLSNFGLNYDLRTLSLISNYFPAHVSKREN